MNISERQTLMILAIVTLKFNLGTVDRTFLFTIFESFSRNFLWWRYAQIQSLLLAQWQHLRIHVLVSLGKGDLLCQSVSNQVRWIHLSIGGWFHALLVDLAARPPQNVHNPRQELHAKAAHQPEYERIVPWSYAQSKSIKCKFEIVQPCSNRNGQLVKTSGSIS